MLHDLVIVGAGPVGATLALAVADADLDVVVLDARAKGETPRGDRTLALSHGARLIFERLGVWGALRGDARRSDADHRHRHLAGGRIRASRDCTRAKTTCLRWVMSSAIARCRPRSMRRSRAQAFASGMALRLRPSAGRPLTRRSSARAASSRFSRGSPPSPMARAPPSPACRGNGTTTSRLPSSRRYGATFRRTESRTSGSRPTARWPCCRRGTITGSSGPRRRSARKRCSRFPKRRSSRSSTAILRRGCADSPASRRVARFRSRSNTRPRRSARAARFSAMPRRRCIPSPGQGFNVGLRDAFELAQAIIDAPRDSLRRRADAAAPCARPARGSLGRHRIHPRPCQAFRQRCSHSCAGRAGWRSLCSTRCRRRNARSRGRCCSACASAKANARAPADMRARKLRRANRLHSAIAQQVGRRERKSCDNVSHAPRNGYNSLLFAALHFPLRPRFFRRLCASDRTFFPTISSLRRWRA